MHFCSLHSTFHILYKFADKSASLTFAVEYFKRQGCIRMKGFCQSIFSFKTLTTLLCLGVVSWQTFECFKKYLKRPHGTDLKIIEPRAENLPLFTICKDSKPKYKEHILKSCNIHR